MGVSLLPPTAGLLWVLVSWRPCRPPPPQPLPFAEVPLCAEQKTSGGSLAGEGGGADAPGCRVPLCGIRTNHRDPSRGWTGTGVSGRAWGISSRVPLSHGRDPTPWRARPPQSQQGDERLRLQTLHTLLQQLRAFYQDDLQQLILMTPPNVQLLARDPLTEQGINEMRKLLLLLLGAAVQCERKAEVIERIQGLDIETQTALAGAIQEVTQDPGVVLSLQWGALAELHPLELTRVLQELSSRLRGLVQERDASAERLWELQQEREVSSPHGPLSPEGPWDNRQHLGVQLADARGQARRLRQELEEKSEELLDQRQELQELEAELRRLRQEHRAVAGEARLAGLYRDELDAMREKAARAERLQGELSALRERLPALERCRGRLEEERAFSQALLDSKAQLEGQLESARARAQHLPQLEKENLLLRSQLEQVEEERERERQQLEELQQEKVLLEGELRQNLGESQHLSWEEEQEPSEAPNDPAETPKSLSYEVTEVTSSRLLALERENQELRRRLQEALEAPREPRSPGLEQKNKALSKEVQRLGAELEAQRARSCQEREELSAALLGEKEQLEQELRSLQEQRHCEESLQSQGDPGTWAQEQQEALAESGRRLCQVEERASSLQEALRRLEATHAKALEGLTASQEARGRLEQELLRLRQELEQQRLEALLLGQLEAEAQALEKEREALRAELSQAEQELAEARGSLEAERQRTGRQAEQAREAAEELRASERELGTLQRGLEQHKAALTQLEGERGALEAVLSQAERERRALDKETRRLRAQTQAQEEALAEQGRRAAQLEAQSRLQALELGGLRETAQRLRELEQESKGLREQLAAERKASAALREELLSEKVKGQEQEADLVRLREQLERREEEQRLLEEQQGTQQSQYQSLEQRLELSFREMLALKEEKIGALRSQVEELLVLNQHLGKELRQVKSSPGAPLPEVPGAVEQDQGNPELALGLRAEPESDTLSKHLIEVERSNAALLAEKEALLGRLGQLESQLGALQGELLSLQGQSGGLREESGRLQAQCGALQVEQAALLSQKAALEARASELRERLAGLEAEVRVARQERDEWRGRHEGLVRNHDKLALLHERQGAELEGLLGKQAGLKGALRALEQEHRELQDRHSHLVAQQAGLEQREAALRGERERLEGAEREHRQLGEQHARLQDEHARVQVALAAAERAQEEQQGELRGLRGRLTGLQLEQARLEAEGTALREQNHQLEVALGRIGDQCELLAQLKGNQEEENRHLLQEIQKLSQENRSLLERSMESREQYHSEQRQHLDKLNELRREKQKLVEKIMDQYRVLEPALPKSKKSSNWIADKMKKLMKPRREPSREQQRPLAQGANSIENLPGLGQDGRAPDGDSSAPASPVPLRKASSVLSLPDAQRVHLRLNRRKLSSRVLVSESFGPGDATPRQRFRQRQRPLAFLGGSREEAAAPWEAQEGQRLPSAGSEEGGLPQGKEKAPLTPQLSQ
ncbi:coiled-coil domain-containing protein 88B isoform X1 [Malaclemys terrapin pileata]|uniref:coiled-coil domain-containing protein 88B isoform X1 n=1 Tax=Malaclemys terrapin pileata TaxID=2991368 RepID=UPI0023A7B492|nr:coiled-coil domain-containing protein 88B isoform X1 [Malaclemys terrapin pileata]